MHTNQQKDVISSPCTGCTSSVASKSSVAETFVTACPTQQSGAYRYSRCQSLQATSSCSLSLSLLTVGGGGAAGARRSGPASPRSEQTQRNALHARAQEELGRVRTATTARGFNSPRTEKEARGCGVEREAGEASETTPVHLEFAQECLDAPDALERSLVAFRHAQRQSGCGWGEIREKKSHLVSRENAALCPSLAERHTQCRCMQLCSSSVRRLVAEWKGSFSKRETFSRSPCVTEKTACLRMRISAFRKPSSVLDKFVACVTGKAADCCAVSLSRALLWRDLTCVAP
ncbi:hypothetical protein TGVEG_228020 [Toxoplasma gondii VEG]|uniref:Uncharacterized protein n=1 Tax=Toxoplasma gondii (strain ATCC 50861 / VEG) TaxID=432359 RepID=B9Q8C9_TOXGV|nr:hypothetical protein TGVEG_228020 [Toxoplasma gondii VEG]CEL76371.1 TPA: hypothetical protein BN1205_068800 [Toxoplasma gondii VEG]